MKTSRYRVPACLMLLSLAGPLPLLQGQDGSVSIVPRAGIHSVESPRVDLTRIEPGPRLAGGGTAGFGESAIVGVSVDVDLPPPWLDLRVSLDRTVGAEVASTDIPFRTDASLTTLGTDILFRPLPSARSARPLLAVGWGMTRFALEGRVPDAAVLDGSRIEGALRLGLGVDLAWGPSIVRLEVMDSISLLGIGGTRSVLPAQEAVHATIGSGVPNDFLITVGAVIPLD